MKEFDGEYYHAHGSWDEKKRIALARARMNKTIMKYITIGGCILFSLCIGLSIYLLYNAIFWGILYGRG